MNKTELVEAIAKDSGLTNADARKAVEAFIGTVEKSLKKGDEIVVIAGTERGKRGKVISILTGNDRVIVEGIKMIKRHTRKNQQNPNGAIVEREGSIHLSNVMHALKRDQEALDCLDKALAIKPDDPLALGNRGSALLTLSRPQDALASFEALLRLDPRNGEAVMNRGVSPVSATPCGSHASAWSQPWRGVSCA